MTTIIRLKQAINNASAPYIAKYDPIESQTGSLLLWDAGLSKLQAVPAINYTFENKLESYSSAAGNAITLTKGDFGNTQHDLFIKRELSSKGGIHFAISRTYAGDTYATLNNALVANAALQEKIRAALMGANPNLFVSVWDRITRTASAASIAPNSSYISSAASTNDYGFFSRSDESIPRVSSQSISSSHLGKIASDPSILNLHNKNNMNLKGVGGAGVLANTKIHFTLHGYVQPWASSQVVNKAASRIIYRIYVEDLTLSGRTYAEVKAIDDAEFTKAFAAGGRFYGDTWSDPATLLP